MRKLFLPTALLLLASSPAFANPDSFLTKAIRGDNSEIRLGRLAVSQGRSGAVRSFGDLLVHGHMRARAMAIPVARRHGVPVPGSMMPEAQAEYRRLQVMHGRAFDREFAGYMVEDHRKDIADFQREIASGDPADVRRLARNTLPSLRQHLRVARSIPVHRPA